MPYKHVVKVSESVYRKLKELTRRLNVESPNQALEKLLSGDHRVTPSTDHRVTPSPIKVMKRDHFWVDVVIGEGYDTEYIALNKIQYEKLCRTGLMHPAVCKQAP
jgi:hypothetical protein